MQEMLSIMNIRLIQFSTLRWPCIHNNDFSPDISGNDFDPKRTHYKTSIFLWHEYTTPESSIPQSTRHKQLKVGVVKIKDRIIHANPWLLGTVFYTINIPKDKLDALKPA